MQVAVGGTGDDGRRDAVGAEDDVRTARDLGDVVDEHRTALLERRHDVDVVDDLLADVDGLAVLLERFLDRDHRSVHPGAVAAWCREQHLLRTGDRLVTQSPTRRVHTRRGERDRVAVGDRHVPDDR